MAQARGSGRTAERAAALPAGERRVSLLARLLRRWRRDLDTGPAPPAAPAPAPRRAAGPDTAEPPPPLDRITILHWLWGEGYTIPGNAEHVLGLVKPFGLNPAMSMLDIAAGLGGPARRIAEEFGTYVTGHERSPELARRGMEMSVAHGMVRRAPVTAIDPETFELRPGAFDCILGREATHAVLDKERFLRVLVQGLKPRGQLLLTDFVLHAEAGEHREVEQWAAMQPFRPRLWTVAEYVDCLSNLGLDLRITEDMTAQYQSQILTAWAALVENVDLRSMPRAHLVAIVDEAERWVRTVAALDTGALRHYRFYAIASGRPGMR